MSGQGFIPAVNDTEIAIIGMNCRFPGARSVDEFWQNLKDGKESIVFFSEQDLESAGIGAEKLNQPNYVKANGVLADVEMFDASFFGFSAREAEVMDPQHRLFLESAWEALETAGYNPETYEGLIGVYAGAGMNSYLLNNIYPVKDALESVGIGEFQLMLASDKDFLPTRVSYKLNLTGPSVNVQTACSTSLVTVHLACQSLLNGECDMALAGGVTIRVPQKTGYVYKEGTIFSPDGHCRAFDAQAQGTIVGNGLGVVVLKRLANAIADGDCIYAVIKGSAINNDGSMKVAYTAPSVDGQAAAIAEALAIANVDPETIHYVEAHGTGTVIGDPIEVTALTQAFGNTKQKHHCAIGSVKTNVGHLDTAAGVAGLIKTVLALKYKLIPPSLHFENPNPSIDFENSPFFVNASLSEWEINGTPRRAGVSSFGIGGTNAHVILEEAPLLEPSSPSRPWKLLLMSAKTNAALETLTTNFVKHLEQNSDINLADVAYTLSQGRRAFGYRRMILCQDTQAAVTALSYLDANQVFTHFQEPQERPIAFMFSGQGTQYINMGRELYATEPIFREQVDLCAEILQPILKLDLRPLLYPSEEQADQATQQLQQTDLAQPSLFIIEYALAKLLEEWGLHPQAMIGHSIGEFVAACLSGVLTLEDALHLVAMRGRLMASLPSGGMLSIALPVSELQSYLSSELSIAANNAPSLCVVSGSENAVAQLEEKLVQANISCRRLHTSHAFHSTMMEPILQPFMEAVQQVQLNPPQIPYISNVTGTWITAAEATDPRYWAEHVRQTVQFGEGLKNLVGNLSYALVEIGPGRVLSTLARQCLGTQNDNVILSTIRHPQQQQSDVSFLLTTLGRLWMSSVNIDWSGFYKHERRHRLPLPTYPFERCSYWIEPQATANTGQALIDLKSWEETEASEAENASVKLSLSTCHPRLNLTSEYVAPREEREELVAQVWQDFLGVAPIGIYDNFFELGGHSLLAAQVMEKVSETLNLKIPIRILTESPTIAGIIASTSELSDRTYSKDDEVDLPPVVSNPEQLYEPFPLREMQQAQWIGRLSGFNLGDVSAHVYFEVESHQIDLERLNQSWKKMMARHPMLNAIILPDGRQQILKDVPEYDIKVVDLRGQSEEIINAHLNSERERLSHVVRPLDKWPLFEICATRIDEKHVRLFLSFEFISTDVGSLRILSRDWHRFYRGDEHLMEPLEISFRDYVFAEAAIRETPLHKRSLEYWKERVKTLPLAPELPMVKPFESLTRPEFNRRALRLNTQEWEFIKQQALKYNVTHSSILLAAFSKVLANWSKRGHFIMNVTIFNRLPLHRQVRYLIGEFGSFDLLEINASQNTPFIEFARQIQNQAWEDLEYRYISGVRVLRELAQAQGGNAALVPVVFTSTIVQYTELDDTQMYTWLGDIVYQVSQTPQLWLDFSVIEDRGELELTWVIIEELFPPGLVDAIWETYCRFMKELSHNEDLWQASSYNWLPAEQLALRNEVNATTGTIPEGLLQTPFINQVSQRPDQAAIIAAERTLSYRELYRRANQLGRQLRSLNVQPNTLVGVVIDKGWEQIVAILGVLNAGAAYLPINPDLPKERLSYLIEHGQVNVVITCDGQPLTPDWSDELQVVAAVQAGWEGAAGDPLTPVQHSDDLAYVLYTSGSTGTPKGVMLSHRAALNTILDINQRFNVNAEDKVLALSSLSFDLSVYDIFGMLAAGGTIVIPAAGTSRDPKHWLELIHTHHITVWNSVPALMEMLVEHIAGQSSTTPLTLKLVLMSGDWIPVSLPERIQQITDNVQVVSLGGATEAAIWSIAYPIEQVDAEWQSIPYGKPLKNQWFEILNERLEPCPAWVPGQLYIGGIGLAKGYWRDEEKTNASFIIHPTTGKRLYRTGDLGRYLPDGNIEFIGREDFQVKIRGYRIELGEVEAALVQHPMVKTAVAVAVDSASHHRRLIAYIVPQSGDNDEEIPEITQETLIAEVRQWVESKLPAYMIPQNFVLLKQLPLTLTGKVDRKALMSPSYIGEAEAEKVNNIVASDPIAAELATIVADMLGVPSIGIHQNFFEIGGDSIMAVQIIARANAQGYELNPQDLFTHQTIAELAQIVKKTTKKERVLTGRVPLTPFQQRLLENGLAELSQNVQQVILELPKALNQQLTEQTLQYLIQNHDALRLRFVQEESGWSQMLVDDTDFSHVPFIDLSPLFPEEQELAITQMTAEMRGEINLSSGLLTKMAVFELGEGRSQLVWMAHQLIINECSWKILLNDFATVYNQLDRGETAWLLPTAVSFPEWVEQVQQHITSASAENVLAPWLKLAESNSHLSLFKKTATKDLEPTFNQIVSVSLSQEETKTLLEEVPSTYRMFLTETVIAALVKVLSTWTGKHQLLIDIECEAREDLFPGMDLTRTVGCLTSVFPLLLDTSGIEGYQNLLKTIKEQFRSIQSCGVFYDGLRWNADADIAKVLQSVPQPEIAFRNLGNFDWQLPTSAPIALKQPFTGPSRHDSDKLNHSLDLTVFISHGQFQVSCRYCQEKFDWKSIEVLANNFIDELRAIIAHCQTPDAGAYSPNDFPYADLNQEDLETLLSSLN